MNGLMMDAPLLLSGLIEYAAEYHSGTGIVARDIEGDVVRLNYAQSHQRIKRLAKGLKRLGVRATTRVASLAWSTHRHFECFYAVTGIQAVLHTVNPRLYDEQIIYIINHAEDEFLLVDTASLAIVERIADRLPKIRNFIIMAEAGRIPPNTLRDVIVYEDLVAGEDGNFEWPSFDERSASTICYTSGSTGNPKGVVYSHRASMLQTMTNATASWMPGTRNGVREVLMPVAPMFHGNAWNQPFLCCYTGSKLVLPGRAFEAEKLFELIDGERVSIAAAVPTVWMILTDWMKTTGRRPSALRLAMMSGSPPSRELMRTLVKDFNLDTFLNYGSTEVLGGSAGTRVPLDAGTVVEDEMGERLRSGRAMFTPKIRIVDENGKSLPKDGVSKGHVQFKGTWVASGYLNEEGGSPLDSEGWFFTGDIGSIDNQGRIVISDRAKDVVKSGGEWISSQELEAAAASHPGVAHASVIGVPHPKWQERPLLIVIRKPGTEVDADQLLKHLAQHVAKWWLPDAIEFVDELPMTGTGKVHKPTLRAQYKDYQLVAEPAAKPQVEVRLS
ncbi:long-chain-fatty-acid--CoA ligase [Chelatococcus asaccharovorans]|uniref:long-chain-fatty-acid--CoA ligase n=1 Tax=Chelatococcus asaccharovorans TaxID=28210 RepID=UPI00224C6B2C|nr:long-chain-fatty-acid--CoA ligase [Chelatococcus asaccharovorans]CAH1663258.1 Medium-chain-fatty-acid--CoA ligase [Chelatococcus asaccharovorans]CAH1682871.1 Medium-chain-fatty-acid--CoA ligase [Chelatococcus asaccharovorans]